MNVNFVCINKIALVIVHKIIKISMEKRRRVISCTDYRPVHWYVPNDSQQAGAFHSWKHLFCCRYGRPSLQELESRLAEPDTVAFIIGRS